MGRKLYLWTCAAALALYAVSGLAWSVANLNDVPHYGDTLEYLRLAEEGSASAHRGVLYPWLLSATEHLCVAGELPSKFAWANEAAGAPCSATAGLVCLQILQVLIGAACLAYFAFVVVGHGLVRPGRPGTRRLVLCGVPALLLIDPLINHFNFALMPDGLAFSASLAFCAAVADLAFRRTPLWSAYSILLVSYLVAAGLRVEKRWTLLATLLGCMALWSLLNRTAGLRLPPGALRRLTLGLAGVGLGLIGIAAVHSSVQVDSFRMPLVESAAHLRLVFPHLSETYPDLPERTKQVISPDDARFYDEHVNNPPLVMARVSHGDEGLRRELTSDLVRTVVSSQWPVIALDFGRDSLENLFATASFYGRLAVWKLWGNQAIKKWFQLDAAVWGYTRLVRHHPQLSVVYVLSSLVLLALAAPAVLCRTRGRLGRGAGGRAALSSAWTPVLVFWFLNAVSFAAYINITNVRYVLPSHAILLSWIYAGALAWYSEGGNGLGWIRQETPKRSA